MTFCLLERDWRNHLGRLIHSTDEELILTTPHITKAGVEFVRTNLSEGLRRSGRLILLTDLSPVPVCQGSTDPTAINCLAEQFTDVEMYHLPKLHAKVFVSGTKQAIVPSGNLTRGGLVLNYEYGIGVDDPVVVAEIRSHVMSYAELAAPVSRQRLLKYCQIAEEVSERFREQLSSAAKGAREEFRKSLEAAENELVKLRLANGPMHRVFENAVLYFLNRQGPLKTAGLHDFIEAAYPIYATIPLIVLLTANILGNGGNTQSARLSST